MSDPEVGSREVAPVSDSGEIPFLEGRLLPILRESTLLPLWLVVAGHIIAFVAPTLILAVRDRRFAAQAALLLLVALSGSAIRAEIRERGGMGLISALVVALWIATGGAALGADHFGIF